MGSDEVVIVGVKDNIKPSVAILNPKIQLGLVESSIANVEFVGFDNVKVSELRLFTKLSAKLGTDMETPLELFQRSQVVMQIQSRLIISILLSIIMITHYQLIHSFMNYFLS